MLQKKSLWAVVTAMLLMVLAMNGAAADEEVFTSGDYRYRILEDGTAEITKYIGGDEALKIPEMLDGKTVTGIGDEAFSWRSSLTSIELPDSVTSMGVNPFVDCESLKNIRVSPEQPVFAAIDGVLFNKAEKSLICYPAGKQEEAYEVPQGIRQIGNSAFESCSSLTSIELPDSVTSIGDEAFYGCSSLTSIELPDSVTSIGDHVFWYCRSLTSIELSDGLTSIGDDTLFGYCNSLTHVKLPDSVTSIGEGAFYNCSSLASIELPDGLMSIGDYAFSSCDSLTNIELPDGLTSIGDGAFWMCSSLTSIELPDSVTSIGISAFGYCDNLTVTVQRDSYAAQYAKDNNLNYTYPDANDWLNN